MAQASRDENSVPTLLGVSNVDGVTPVAIYADPVTHRLLVDATGSLGGLSAEIPAGLVNGINTIYLVSEEPAWLIVDGMEKFETINYTYDPSKFQVTLYTAPEQSIRAILGDVPNLNSATETETPLIKFTNFSEAPNASAVGAGLALYDGWVDRLGNEYDISSGNLRNTTTNSVRLKQLMRPAVEASTDQTIYVQFIAPTSDTTQFVIPWAKFNPSNVGGYRTFITSGNLTIDKCINTTLSDTTLVSIGSLTPNSSYVFEFRAQPAGGGGTLLTSRVYTLANFNAVPRGAAVGEVSTTITDATLDGLNAPAVSMTQFSSTQCTVQNMWTFDNTIVPSTDPLNVTSPLVLGYIGSSTWALNAGSGTVPAMIEANIESAFPGSVVTTQNYASSGTDTEDWLPGTTLNNNLKAAMQGSSGYKVLRMMIGSNNAFAGRSTADWMANMSLIINDALTTWPVDKVYIENIGIRLDATDPVPTLALIEEYNAARGLLTSEDVVVAPVPTFINQSFTLNNLQSDDLHQDNNGNIYLADEQAAEINIL